jgi:hypothetical protein
MERGEAEMDADPVFENQRQLIFNLASSGAIQAIYPWRDTLMPGAS